MRHQGAAQRAAELPRELPREIPEDFADVSVEQEILATGMKVINLLAPYYKGDKTGLTKAEIPKAAELHEELPTKEFLKADEMSKELPTKELPKTAKPPQKLPKAMM